MFYISSQKGSGLGDVKDWLVRLVDEHCSWVLYILLYVRVNGSVDTGVFIIIVNIIKSTGVIMSWKIL